MKAYKYIMAASVAALSLSSCSDDSAALSGEGRAMISATVSGELARESRAAQDLTDKLGESLIVWISNDKGAIRKYRGISELPQSGLTLLSGSYVAEAWCGDSVSASWTDRWYKARVPFEITKGGNTNVELVCKIANVAVSVVWDATIDDVLTDYSLSIGHKNGNLVFDQEHLGERGYFMMPSFDPNLSYTITGTKKSDGVLYTKSGVIEAPMGGHEYVITAKCTPTGADAIGGGFLSIDIEDVNLTEVDESIIVNTAPVIRGKNFDIDKVQRCAPGEVGYYSVYVQSSVGLSEAVVSCAQFADIFDGTEFDAMYASESIKEKLSAAGINMTYVLNDDDPNNPATLRITFDDQFTDHYFVIGANDADANYEIAFDMTDKNGMHSSKTLKFLVSMADADPIEILPVGDDINLRTTSVTLRGNIINAEALNATDAELSICYAPAGTSTFTNVAATVDDNAFSAELTGLTGNTTYKWYAQAKTADDSTFKTAQLTFTTEPATQLPNASFENWQTTSSPYLLYGAGESMFWDSGNHGSATMKKNVTVPSTEYAHSGSTSVELASQFVGIGTIGQFAAGNVFIGKFIATEKTTHGILGWGRPFTERPVKLHGWVRYRPQTVDYASSDHIEKGETDQGIIYIALMDDNLMEYNGDKWPVIVRTSIPQLFDSTSKHVIAYGEKVFTADTEGDGMIEFEIKLDYRDLTQRPSYIVLTAAASRYGDYFAGANGTKMWIDDLELIY